MDYIIVAFLVSLSALFSGLTLGLLGLDLYDLKRKVALNDPQALKIYSVRKQGNFLLSTLLFGNVAVNCILPLFLNSIASGVVAGAAATSLIFVFGEILPQAFCSRYALLIGAKTAWIVKIFMVLFSPICWPLSRILDHILGREFPTTWTKEELKEIIKEHEDAPEKPIDEDEERIVLGALTYSEKTAKDILTPRKLLYTLEIETELSQDVLKEIREKGFSRIPVYEKEKDNIVGILFAKDLIGVSPGEPLRKHYRKDAIILRIPETKNLDALLDKFIHLRMHIAFVFDEYGGLEGIVTLEDVIEEVIQVEIVDEVDKVVNLRKEALRHNLIRRIRSASEKSTSRSNEPKKETQQ